MPSPALQIAIGASTRGVNRAFAQLERRVQGFGGRIASIGRSAAIAFGAVTAGAVAIGRATQRAIDDLDSLSKAAANTGVTVEEQFGARLFGALGGFENRQTDVALRRFARRLGTAVEGSGELLPVLNNMGIAFTDLEGNVRPTIEVLDDFQRGLQSLGSQAEVLRAGFAAFDSEGVQLAVTLANSEESFSSFLSRVEELVPGFNEAAEEAVAAKDDITILTTALDAQTTLLFSRFIPALQNLATNILPAFIRGIEAAQDNIEDLFNVRDYEGLLDAFEDLANAVNTIANTGGSIELIEQNIRRLRNTAGQQLRQLQTDVESGAVSIEAASALVGRLITTLNEARTQQIQAGRTAVAAVLQGDIDLLYAYARELDAAAETVVETETEKTEVVLTETQKRINALRSEISQQEQLRENTLAALRVLAQEEGVIGEIARERLAEMRTQDPSIEAEEQKRKEAEAYLSSIRRQNVELEVQNQLYGASAERLAEYQATLLELEALFAVDPRVAQELERQAELIRERVRIEEDAARAERERLDEQARAAAVLSTIQGLQVAIADATSEQTTAERIINQLRAQRVQLTEEELARIRELGEELDRTLELNDIRQMLEGAFAEGAREGLRDFTESGDFNDFFDAIGRRLRDTIINALLDSLVRSLFDSLFGDQGGFGGGILGGLFQGGRQSGGPVGRNRAYLVGERGPELFIPRTDGNVVANNQLGGESVAVTINIDRPTVRNDNDVRRIAQEAAVAAQGATIRGIQQGRIGRMR